MAGYQATQIRKPENETEFEKNIGVLFRAILNDPNVQRLGRRGQGQRGIDLVGHRNGNAKAPVGIQCKLKGDKKKLTESEVKTEVRKALKYSPALTEYFIVTTALNDTNLTALAATLSKQQATKGRKILIEIWGWGTLEDRINEHETAKQAFDPGFSPSIQRHGEQLEAVLRGQSGLATSAQVAGIAARLDQAKASDASHLPTRYADREIAETQTHILRRRCFREARTTQEFAELADRVTSGDLSLASLALRLDVLQRAARAHSVPQSLDKTRYYLSEAKQLEPSLDTTFCDALIDDAEGDSEKALRVLRKLDGTDARTAIFNILSKRNVREALEWVTSSAYQLADFNPAGATIVLLKLIDERRYDEALAWANSLSNEMMEAGPALYMVRTNLNLASALPADQKALIFPGLPVNPRMLRLANDLASRGRLAAAVQDIQKLIPIVRELKLTVTSEYLEELQLWIQLEQPETAEQARAQVIAELADPSKTLWRLRLALFYDLSFNREALSKHLRSRRQLGGWTSDESFAAFLLAFRGESASALAEFFDEYRGELYAQHVLDDPVLAGIEVEAMARAGRFDDAWTRFEDYKQKYLSADQAETINGILTAIESGDETEQVRLRYEQSKSLQDLLFLIQALNNNQDQRQLATYAPDLARATHRVEDFHLAIGALFNERRYDELLALTDELPDLFALDQNSSALKAWSLFYIGRVMEARSVVRDLLAKRNDSNDRELAINTAIESGDWGYLQSILTSERSRIDQIDPPSLMRLARLALEVGSPYVDQFREAALKKANDDPQVYVAAYMLSVERGDEDRTPAHQWLEKAVSLSGPEGPVQQMPLKGLIDQAAIWNRHVSHVDKSFREGQVPMVLAAHALRRQPIEFIFGQALRNQSNTDVRSQAPILAFSGLRPPVVLGDVQKVALDLTTIFTLEYLGLLQNVLDTFSHVMIAPSTLSTLFTERQFLRVRQPSEQAKAQRIQALISSEALRLVPAEPASAIAAELDIDEDLATMLSRARAESGVVILPGPVFKRSSFMEQPADLSGFSGSIADTHSVLKFLTGKVDASVEANAAAYLKQVDQGWASNASINKDATIYLDDLAVTYLDQVHLLEPLTRAVRAVFVDEEIDDRTKGALRFADQADALISSVEHIRSTLNKALDANTLRFTHRKLLQVSEGAPDTQADSPLPPMPTLDILSNLEGIDAVTCDDRFFNKEPAWSDPRRRVPTVTSLDLLGGLLDRGKLTAGEYRSAKYKLRLGGYYAVPATDAELLEQIDRANLAEGAIVETPELRAIRESLLIGRRTSVFIQNDEPWLGAVRLAFVNAIRELWQRSAGIEETLAKTNWLLAFLPDPLNWCLRPEDETAWTVATQQTAAQYAMLASFFINDDARRQQYINWIEPALIQPVQVNQPWLWQTTLGAVKNYVKKVLEAAYGR